MLTALIIDDEAPSREELKALLAEAPDVEVVGECANAIEGLSAIHRLRPDVVFLDIQMPRVSGLEMVGMIEPSALPHIVFVTAYDEHALKAFEEHAADYLLKPIDPKRLAKTLDWLRSGARPSAKAFPGSTDSLRQIPCIGRNRIFLLGLDEVEFVHTDVCGVQVVATNKLGITELTLKILQERTPLMRCHRQYLINIDHIAEIELLENGAADIVTHSGKRVPVSRRHLREIKRQTAYCLRVCENIKNPW
ncbi:two-component system response regulator BtsR [Propionivibrio sp.]|uniref:two-component system response regulator BtsR n=1 Tax=Propionivibrio sp. TaxID=2212460 RepID=UPI003BF28EE8